MDKYVLLQAQRSLSIIRELYHLALMVSHFDNEAVWMV
jgi:hypothetical protein